MRFMFEHIITADPKTVAGTILDLDYQHSIEEVVSDYLHARQVLSQEERPDGKVSRRIRCVLGIDLPSAARRFIGDQDPAWVEDALYDPDSLMWEWDIHPEAGGRLLSSGGMMALGEHTEGTLRRVTGDVSFRVPVYGGRVEEIVVDHLDKIYDTEAHHLASWIHSAP
jgi:hypothetical protein